MMQLREWMASLISHFILMAKRDAFVITDLQRARARARRTRRNSGIDR